MQVRDAMRRCRRAGAGHASHQAAGGLDWELDGGSRDKVVEKKQMQKLSVPASLGMRIARPVRSVPVPEP